MLEIIDKSLQESSDTFKKTCMNDTFKESLNDAAQMIISTYNSQGKVMLAGNGGSAADAQHICAELVGRLNFDRNPLPAIALTTNTSNLTCIANDYGYEDIFTRQFNALAQPNDTLVVYTTSGKSPNVLSLLESAHTKIKNIIALTGKNTDHLKDFSKVIISVNSSSTTKIQEIHAIAGHIICECVEDSLFKK